MQRTLATIALIVLCCSACATVEKVAVDARLMEAQKAFDEGWRLKGMGQYAKAVPHAERALKLREAVLGRIHPEVADSLALLGDVHLEQGSYALVEPLFQRALEIRQKVFGQSHPDVAASFHDLAKLYEHLGHYARVEPLYQRALAIREMELGEHHPDVATSLHALAYYYYYYSQGRWIRVEPLYRRALAIREAALGHNHPDVATSLNALGLFYMSQWHFGLAEPLFQRALAIQEVALGHNHPDVATPLDSLAHLHHAQGNYSRAQLLHERALALREATFGSNHPQIAKSLDNIAGLNVSQGNYARAEPLYQRALKIWETTRGKNNPQVANSLNSLGIVYWAQGVDTRAEPLWQRAIDIYEATLGKEHNSLAPPLHNLASLHARKGYYAGAELLYQRALKIWENTLGKESLGVANVLCDLAILYRKQGLYARAESLFQRSLAIREGALSKNHPDIAESLYNLAVLYSSQERYAQAEPLFRRALTIREKVLGKSHPDIAESLHNLARLRLAQQQLDQALPLFERALIISEQHLRQECFEVSEVRLTSLLQQLRAKEDYLYALVRAHPNDARVRHLVLTTALLRKGRSVEEIADRLRTIYRSVDDTGRKDFERLRSLHTQRSTLSLAGPGRTSLSDYQQRLKELADQCEALETNLSRRSEPFRALHESTPPTEILARVAATLPSDGALVEFIAYHDMPLIPKSGTPEEQGPNEFRYLALLLFPNGRTEALDLGPAAPLDAAIQRLHVAFSERADAYQSAAQELYTRAFRPLVPLLGKVQRIFLSPDGQLSLVPFAALHDGKRFLMDGFDITYLTSGKELLRRSESSPPARSVMVLAEPDYRSPPTGSGLAAQTVLTERSASLERFYSTRLAGIADQDWKPLPGTRQEAEAIRSLLPQAKLLLGHEATKEALLRLERPGVLHVATHAFWLEDAPTVKEARAVKSIDAIGDRGPLHRPPDPMMRSGLVLAGAGAPEAQSSGRRREDSLVTALELAGMNLWGTQLVVLSACDTGRGDVKVGQGVYGLRRALVVAGAETVVTSLWQVNDRTTGELMAGYYRKLLAGQGRATALREAMKELREKKPHPYYWAPFITIGQDTPLRGLAPLTAAPPFSQQAAEGQRPPGGPILVPSLTDG